jgi:phenylpropionate dioxygenase-like ring-hydroxylating dioxygenase large terminal subunit
VPFYNAGLWQDYWHLLCHRSEIKKSRDFVRFDVAGQEVVAFHDGAEIIAFNNLCPHRGARIFDGTTGNAPFLCRYHGWSYSKGKVFIADKAQFAHCDPSSVRLTTLKTTWVGDFLFVSTTPVLTIEQQLSDIYETVRAISNDLERRLDVNTYDYDCVWQVAVENALEPYHVSMIHADSLNQLKLGPGRNEYHGVNSIWYTDIQNTQSARRLEKLGKLFQLSFQHPGYVNIYLYPFSMISSTFGLTYSIQHFFPSSDEDRAHFVSRLYQSQLRSGLNPNMLDSFFASTAEMNRQIFREDNNICRRVPSRSWSAAAPKVYARDEERLVHFRETYRQTAGNSA